jgi:hypothetical protein
VSFQVPLSESVLKEQHKFYGAIQEPVREDRNMKMIVRDGRRDKTQRCNDQSYKNQNPPHVDHRITDELQ